MTEAPRRIEAVTFDLGDTLWHFPEPRTPEAVAEHFTNRVRLLLRGWGLSCDVTPAELQQRLRSTRAEADRAADGGDWRSPDYLAITDHVARDAGLDLTPGQVAELWQAMNTGGHFLGRRLFEDTIETLDWLQERGTRIAALTNRTHGGAVFLEELRQDGILHYFEVVISSDQVGYRKPHPRIFEAALEALALEGAQVAHVGDRPDVDVRGARAAGMYAIWMRRLTPPDHAPDSDDEVPDASIERLAEMRDLRVFADQDD